MYSCYMRHNNASWSTYFTSVIDIPHIPHKRSGNNQLINDAFTMFTKVPVLADVGEVITVLTLLAVGEVTVVGVVVLSLMHTQTHTAYSISDKSRLSFSDM